ncbi:DegT/DnrJ/EryC1/StrS family aminotransferase [archaeon]|nr:MAG: DegT/DnrJ/EryC1/StrS family aminotransferase [archaeon]
MKPKIPLSRPLIGKVEEKLVSRVLRSGILSRGPIVESFESAFAQYIGVKHGLAVCNGTAALHLALLAHGVRGGDNVITTPFTFIASANSILYTGAKPVFVDIDRDTYNIDPTKIEEAIDNHTKAVLPVHVFGVSCDMKAIMEICEDHGLILVEDACEAIGTKCNGKMVGSFSTSCFSFYPNKPITTGEGGMVLTDNDEIARRVDALRNLGRLSDGWLSHELIGYNYRLSDIHAAVGLAQLRRIKSVLRKRDRVAHLYSRYLKNTEGVRAPTMTRGRSWFVYVVEVDRRDEVAKKMKEKGIECKPYFPPVHLQEPYRDLGFKEGDFPICEEIGRRVLALPFYSHMSSQEVELVVSCLQHSLSSG